MILRRTLAKWAFHVHLWVGVVTGVLFIVVGVTGRRGRRGSRGGGRGPHGRAPQERAGEGPLPGPERHRGHRGPGLGRGLWTWVSATTSSSRSSTPGRSSGPDGSSSPTSRPWQDSCSSARAFGSGPRPRPACERRPGGAPRGGGRARPDRCKPFVSVLADTPRRTRSPPGRPGPGRSPPPWSGRAVPTPRRRRRRHHSWQRSRPCPPERQCT